MNFTPRISLRDPRTLILADQTFMSASGFLSNFLLAWKLQLSTYGQYALVFLGMMLLMTLQQALFIQPAQVFIPKYSRIRQQKLTGALLLWALPFLLFSSFIFELVFKLIYSLDITPGILTIVCCVWLLSDLMRKLVILIEPKLSLLLLDGLNASVFVLLIVFVQPVSLLDALNYLGFSSAIGLFFLIVLKPVAPSSKYLWYYFSKTRKTAGWMILTSVVQWSSSNYLILASGTWINASALGVLRLTQYVFGLLNIFLQAYESYAVPQAVKFKGSWIEKAKFIQRISIPFLLPVALLTGLITVFFPILISMIHSASYDQFIQFWFAGLYAIILVGYPVRVFIRSSGYNSIYFLAHAVSLLFMLLTASSFIQAFQLNGVVMGMILSQLIMLVIWALFILRKNQFTWKLSTSHSVR